MRPLILISLLFVISFFYTNHLNAQNFTLEIENDTSYMSEVYEIDHVKARIKNVSSEILIIDVLRVEYDRPQHWINGMCVDGTCYDSSVDSTQITIDPDEEVAFQSGFSFWDVSAEPIVEAKYIFVNISNPDEQISFNTYGVNTAFVTSIYNNRKSSLLSVFPNPAQDIIVLDTDLTLNKLKIFNLKGEFIMEENIDTQEVNISKLNAGHYIMIVETPSEILQESFIKF